MWEHIDLAVCLTVDGSSRKDEMLTDAQRVGLSVEVRSSPKVPRDDSVVDGCSLWSVMTLDNKCCEGVCVDTTKSHLEAIEYAYNEGKRNVLIFEDDARWNSHATTDKLKKVLKWLETHDYDMFFFGQISWPNPVGVPKSREVMKVFHPLLAHAYVVSRKCMPTLIANKDRILTEKISIDAFYAHHTPQLAKYACYPSMNDQCVDPLYYKKGMSKLGLGWIPSSAFVRISNFVSYYSILLLFLLWVLFVVIVYRYVK